MAGWDGVASTATQAIQDNWDFIRRSPLGLLERYADMVAGELAKENDCEREAGRAFH